MKNYHKWLMAVIVTLFVLAGTGLVLWGGADMEAGHETFDARARQEAQRTADLAVHRDDGGSVWGEDYFPNVELTTHEGETVRFFDDMIEDKVVAINFIYTTCPDACPMETARLMEVAEILGDRMGEDIFFYSITIDPENDTWQVLNQHVKNWGVGPGWTFLTGSEEDIVLLRQKLGIYIEEIQAEDSLDHNLSLIIGNQATGRWMKRSPYENPHILATQLGSWLHNWQGPSHSRKANQPKRSYEDAPELRDISTGELLFRTRCASCHTIGHGDVADLNQRRIGPDLYMITQQRDEKWLRRWLTEPDQMLAEKDPLAMALYEEYNRVPMPNLRLTDTDVDNLFDYIEEESRVVQRQREMRRAEAEKHQNMDHSQHAGMDHGDMDHGEMDHGGMDHGDHADMDHSGHSGT